MMQSLIFIIPWIVHYACSAFTLELLPSIMDSFRLHLFLMADNFKYSQSFYAGSLSF